jgi:uncharacterized coiled-coil protein SlyX
VKAGEYAKGLEQTISEKDGYIAQLEQAVAESRNLLEDCAEKISGMESAFKELQAIQQAPGKKRRKH